MDWAIPFDVQTPPQMNSLSEGSQNFICPGDSYCNICFVIHFYIVLSRGQTLQLSVVREVRGFVTGCSSVGGVWTSNGIAHFSLCTSLCRKSAGVETGAGGVETCTDDSSERP